jgi:hypothetical protein
VLFAVQVGPPQCQLCAAIPAATRTVPYMTSARAARVSALSARERPLRCRPIALAPPNRPLRKFPVAADLSRAARRQARNLADPQRLGHALLPMRTRRHLGGASRHARYAGESDPDRTPVRVVHQVRVPTQVPPRVCCLCTTQISRTATPGPLPQIRADATAPLAHVVDEIVRQSVTPANAATTSGSDESG